MRDQLRALAKLAEIDTSAKDLDEELLQIPARIEEMRGDVSRLEALLERERRELADAESLRDAQLSELSGRNEMLARGKAKSAQARNAREAEAAEREVESIRRSMKEREDEKSRLNDAIENVRSSLAQHELEFEELKKLCGDEESKANDRLAELNTERDKVVKGRDEVTAVLPRNVVSTYERIRKSRGTAVVEVIEGTCQGCRMKLPPQQYIELQRATSLEQCPACVRMIFYRPAIDD